LINKSLTVLAAAATLVAASNANAYAIFTGADGNNNPNVPLSSMPNATAAETAFKSHLTGVGTETFEGRSGAAPLPLSFGAAGTATLQGGGMVSSAISGTTNGGRYSVGGGSNYWEVEATQSGGFQVIFSQDIAAFGFYGTDIGDFGGTLSLQFLNDSNVVISTVVVPTAAANVADGSALYFGAIAANNNELFKSVRFVSTLGTGDVFGFDNLTIGAKEQVTSVPEPTTLALLSLGVLGFAAARRKSAKK